MKKFENFSRALDNLIEGASSEPPYSIVVETGIAALFQICFEQAWKTMKVLLEDHGRTEGRIGSPKMIIKLAYQCGMIDDEEIWLNILETRNVLAHTYNPDEILNIIGKIKNSYLPAFVKLKAEIAEKWV